MREPGVVFHGHEVVVDLAALAQNADLAVISGMYRSVTSSPARSAHSLRHSGDGTVVAGHLELLGEVRSDTLEIARVVDADPAFLRQLPPDWKS